MDCTHSTGLEQSTSVSRGIDFALSDYGSLSGWDFLTQVKFIEMLPKGVQMNWELIVFPNKLWGHLFKILTTLACCFIGANAFGQFTIDATNTSQATTMNLPGDDILFLRVTVNDPDYDDEGELFVNGNGPIQLWPGGNSGNDGLTMTINLDLNNTQRGYFINGTNNLEFRFAGDPTVVDGYRVDAVEPVTSLPTKNYQAFDIDVDAPISASRSLALEIYKRLVGVATPIDNPVLVDMEQQINAGNLRGAAAIATEQPGFYNLVVRDLAAQMSTRDESINEPLNDFIATFIGVARDDLDARLLLTGNFFYKGSIEAPVRSDIYNDILGSNRHYDDLNNDNYDLTAVLTRENQQYIRNGDQSYVNHPDASGVITTRAFMGAHALDGTNRRLVEFTMNQFACFEMEEWADATASDIRVGRDIDRAPGGEATKYLTTCKACHSVMDGFRGAFAKYDFNNNFVNYDFDPGPGTNSVDRKMNQNNNTFPGGFVTNDNSWINNARNPANIQRFGWRGVVDSGVGVRQFATAVANSRAFSKCMVKRVYREVCRRPVATFETGMVDSMANSFEASGYSLKGLFEELAVRPECIGAR